MIEFSGDGVGRRKTESIKNDIHLTCTLSVNIVISSFSLAIVVKPIDVMWSAIADAWQVLEMFSFFVMQSTFVYTM